jgi:hypothetical protein
MNVSIHAATPAAVSRRAGGEQTHIRNVDRRAAIVAGVLYIVGTVAGFLSLSLSQPLRAAADPLAGAAANAVQLTWAALCVMLMGLSLAMLSVVVYPVLRRHSPVLALGYVVFRGALETMGALLTAYAWLLFVALGRSYAQAGAAAGDAYRVAGGVLLQAGDMGAVLGIVFCLGALMFYTVLYRSRLVPRWLTVWGLAAVVPYLAAEFLVVFALLDPMSSTAMLLFLPMAVQEMVLAVWLIVKGFNPAALTAPAQRAPEAGLPQPEQA